MTLQSCIMFHVSWRAGRKERNIAMGDKGKGSNTGKVKKPKAAKRGLRPHEERQRDALSKPTPTLARSV